MHIDAVKEFYTRLTMRHYKKKEVARSSVRGVEIEFDHLRLASILGIPGNNGICEYIKDAWEESKYSKPLEIIRKFANDETILVEEPETEAPAVPIFPASPGDSTNVQKEQATAGVDPSAPAGSIPDAIFSSLQADFERARANRIQADLEKAKAENVRLLTLLQQAKSQPQPEDFPPIPLGFLLTALSIFCLNIATSYSVLKH
ncbi:hypothetical protein Dimus_029093 [Dionaea muscipula]